MAARRKASRKAERKHFERTLRANRQVASGEGPLPPGATHVEEKDERGQTRVKRKRFSAV
jgi:hypothetical protein